LNSISNFKYGEIDSAKALQNMIWHLEGEVSLGSGSAFITVLQAVGLDRQTAKDDYEGAAVQALNLTSLDGGNPQQDQLVYVRVPVPDGGLTLTLLGMGLVGLAAVRRKLS